MIELSSADKLAITTSSTANIDYYINFNEGSVYGKISSATTTTIRPEVIINAVKHMVISNVHAATTNVITISKLYKGTSYIIFKCSLLTGERIIYNNGDWKVIDAVGSIK